MSEAAAPSSPSIPSTPSTTPAPAVRRRARSWAPYFVLSLSLLVTAGVTAYVWYSTSAADEVRFQNAVQVTRDSIFNRLDAYILMLRGGTGLFAAVSDDDSELLPQQFQHYVANLELERDYPGIPGVGFSRRVSASERQAVESRMQRLTSSDFRIW